MIRLKDLRLISYCNTLILRNLTIKWRLTYRIWGWKVGKVRDWNWGVGRITRKKMNFTKKRKNFLIWTCSLTKNSILNMKTRNSLWLTLITNNLFRINTGMNGMSRSSPTKNRTTSTILIIISIKTTIIWRNITEIMITSQIIVTIIITTMLSLAKTTTKTTNLVIKIFMILRNPITT
jgi:hypothetical protein